MFGAAGRPVLRSPVRPMRNALPLSLVVLLALAVAACRPAPEPVDLLAERALLIEARAGDDGLDQVLEASADGLRLGDVLYRGFPAGPPGRLRFDLDIPRSARLTFACAIDPRFHDQPAIEFFVKVREGGEESVVWSRLLDPISHPGDRRWVTIDVDLAAHAGRGRELVLETHGYEEGGDPDRALRVIEERGGLLPPGGGR